MEIFFDVDADDVQHPALAPTGARAEARRRQDRQAPEGASTNRSMSLVKYQYTPTFITSTPAKASGRMAY
jgi:hypothetical protein